MGSRVSRSDLRESKVCARWNAERETSRLDRPRRRWKLSRLARSRSRVKELVSQWLSLNYQMIYVFSSGRLESPEAVAQRLSAQARQEKKEDATLGVREELGP